MKFILDMVKTYPFTTLLFMGYQCFVYWMSGWVQQCVDNNFPECAGSTGWLESFNVVLTISVLPLVVLTFITLIIDSNFGKED